MRLTPSSSLFLATLALSSSSSSLAAPTDNDVNGLSTSSDVHSSSRRDSVGINVRVDGVNVDPQEDPASQSQSDREDHRVHPRGGIDLGEILGQVPILGPALTPLMPMLEPIFNALGLGNGGNGSPNALLSLTPSQVSQVQQAVAQAIISVGPANTTELTSGLPAPPVPLPTGAVQNETSSLPAQKRDDYYGGNMTSANCSASQSSSAVSSTWSPVSTYAAFTVPSDVPLDSPADVAASTGQPASPSTGTLPNNPLSPSLPVPPPNTPVAPPFPAGPAPNGSASSSSAEATTTAAQNAFDVASNTTPPLFMSSTAVANSSSTADCYMAMTSANSTSSYPTSTASL